MKRCFLIMVILLVGGWRGFGEEYQGAEAVLKKAAVATEKPSTPAPNYDSPIKLKHDLKAFTEKANTLKPADSAKQWLQFVDRFLALPIDRGGFNYFSSEGSDAESNQIAFQQIAAALPPATAWDALAQELDARAPDKSDPTRILVLRVVAHWLTANDGALKKDLDALDQQPKPQAAYAMNDLRWGLIQNSDDGEAILASLQQRVKKDATAEYGLRLQVPDLVSMIGEEKTAAFLRDALRNEKGEIHIEHGIATEKLARKLALEMVNELKGPQWGLANSLDATALFEAMAKRFPETDRTRYVRGKAQTYYVLGLIAAHRASDAAAFVTNLGSAAGWSVPHEGLAAMERAGYTRDLAQFLHDLLEKNPDLPFWNEYVALAAKAQQTDKMVALIESSAARPGLSPKDHRMILSYLHRAYLAADQIDKAVEVLRQEIALDKSGDVKPKPSDEELFYSYHGDSNDPGLALVRVGKVLGRQGWIDEGIRTVREGPVNPNDPRERANRAGRLNNFAKELMALKRGREAEDLLTEALAIAPDPTEQRYSTPVQPETLSLLLDLYYQAGRADDVLTLLTRAPYWYARDLASIFLKSVSNERDVDYMGLFAADALWRKGRADEAKKIITTLLERSGGYDPAYEYLVKLEGANAPAYLDQLFAHDQFEERPLIWKAKLLFDAGKLEEAEKCARQAIAIDPSDGEQGPGRRMTVYAVLADIREKRGDTKEAETLRGAVTAVRHSEEADRFYGAGLLTRAVKKYEEALTHFTDAYCIQSRLALRMAELGDMAGAEEHYRRAYELMPDSFGRVESHCFGCERAFDGEKAQSIAEKVFTELAAKRPEKPQIHYLLGYLRKAEERYPEALPEFRQAVKLDPEYLNAWKELAESGEKVHLPAKEREAIQFTTLRLDPGGHHSSFRINDIVDCRAAWKALEEAQKSRPKRPETLMPLTASAEEMRKREQSKGSNRPSSVYIVHDFRDDRVDPGSVFAQHHVIKAVIRWFDYGRRG